MAFDASSRLRRAGIELYHTRFAQTKMRCTPSMAMVVSSDGDASQPVPIAQLPPKAADKLRIVAISDTHLLHEGIGAMPPALPARSPPPRTPRHSLTPQAGRRDLRASTCAHRSHALPSHARPRRSLA